MEEGVAAVLICCPFWCETTLRGGPCQSLHSFLCAATSASVAPIHSFTVLSALPLASRRPSGANATDETEPPWPLRVATARCVCTSHSRTVPSSLPLASRRPSGANATDETEAPWPWRVAT